MAWTVEYADSALKQLRKLDRQAASRILDYMEARVAASADPRALGKALHGPLGDLWRYRVGDYRILCDLQDNRLTILVLQLGNRREIYR
ncbi:MAG TPA: type II toxin-antitoxin system RelE/ParE family toxin [Terracidiphilus sp.]